MILQNYISSEYIYGEHRYIPEEYMDEKWWYIRGASGYMISDYGRVWSEKSQKFLKPKPLDDHGHMGVCLYVNGKCRYEYIHRLMAKAFIPNPMNLPVVRHLNDVPDDNDICNLKWGTQKDNIADSIKNEKAHFITDSEREIGLSKMRRPIVAIKIKTGEEVYFNGQNEASRFLGIQQSNIWKVLNGERRHACGYYFEYVRGDYHE
jgi:hypothetical protein